MSLGNKDFGRKFKKYTPQEIEGKLRSLKIQEAILITKRGELNRELKTVRDDIEYYKSIDPNQIKLF